MRNRCATLRSKFCAHLRLDPDLCIYTYKDALCNAVTGYIDDRWRDRRGFPVLRKRGKGQMQMLRLYIVNGVGDEKGRKRLNAAAVINHSMERRLIFEIGGSLFDTDFR